VISQITERPLVNCVLFADYLLECADDEFDRAFRCADNEILDADDEVDYPAVTERGGDDRACVAYRAADGAFLVLRAVLKLCGFLIGLPDIGVSRYIGLVAALALMPVIGVVILPIRAVAVGMAGRRILIGGLELHIIAGHGEGGSRLGGVCQSDIALQHDPLVKDLACLRCVRRNGHNGVLRDLVRDECPCGKGGCALDDRDNVSGRSGVLYEPCLAAVGTLAGVENSFALALFCRFAAVPVVAELINDMTVADNLSAAGCALLVAAIA